MDPQPALCAHRWKKFLETSPDMHWHIGEWDTCKFFNFHIVLDSTFQIFLFSFIVVLLIL